MNWFKRAIDRLFTADDEQNENESHSNNSTTEIEVEQYEKKEKPTFRFPIISDAEIYGWDEDDTETNQPYRETPKHYEEQTEYEPIPFYKNDRWPKEDEKSKVFRADSIPTKQEIHQYREGLNFRETEEDKDLFDLQEKIENRFNKRFNPTNVPSPIFGYSKREANKAAANEEKSASANKEPITTSESSILKSERERSIFNVLDENSDIIETEPKTILADTNPKSENAAKTHDKPEEEYAKNEKPEEPEKQTEQTEQEQTKPEVHEERQLKENKKKERVVPFNVLMLKSDKAKMMKSKQPVSPEKFNQDLQETEIVTVAEPKVQMDPHDETEDKLNEVNSVPGNFAFPSQQFLIPPELQVEDTEWLEEQSEKLEESLSHFGVQATVIDAVQGPTVTRFELTVGQGTKVSRVRNLTDDLKLTLAAKEIRIQAPIPGKSSIGIEIPNRKTRPVRISEVIGSEEFNRSDSPLEAVLGLGLTGEPVTLDLRKMPHGLIAGATGSGKSVCINSILVSLLYKASPSDLKMMLIDPKMVELAPFNGIPHLISPVITDVKAATAALKWAVSEMERRYELLAHAGVRDIERYNKVVTDNKQYSLKMPYLLIVIDELSDLMMMSPADVEVSIIRIAQKARACGIHLIIATQRPSVDVITGTIKANIPTRIAFSVSSQIDSRTIIDTTGAERLLGRGDMLYLGNGQSAAVRLQGTFVTDDEIERIIQHVRNEESPTYLFGQAELLKSAVDEEEKDPLFEDACLFIFEQGSASTSLLQRNFSIGYNRAAKLMDQMEKLGFISEQRGSRARDVYLSESDIEKLTEPIL